jgi:hydrogenase maturation protease
VTVRLVGVGNPLRGDDGAGPATARRVDALLAGEADVRWCDGGAADLLDAFEGAEDVVVVDAACSGRSPGTIRWLRADEAATAVRGQGTHDAGLADAVALGTALGRLPPRLRVCVIEGVDFRLGAPVTPAVAAAVAHLAQQLAAELSAGTPPSQPGQRGGTGGGGPGGHGPGGLYGPTGRR